MLVKRGVQDIDAYIRKQCIDSTIVEFPESEIPELLERLRVLPLNKLSDVSEGLERVSPIVSAPLDVIKCGQA